MKILCVSDQIDPLVYSAAIKERFANVDLVLSAGDLPMEYLDFIMSTLNKPLLFVYGNHHTQPRGRYSEQMPFLFVNEETGAVHTGSRVSREEGLIIAGLGGSIRYNRGDNQFTDFQMYIEIIKLIPSLLINRFTRGRYLDILLTHAPPKGIHDLEDPCHRGFKAFLWFMKMFRPRYLIHGHVHLYDLSAVRATKYLDTMVINAYSHYVIDIGDANEP